jgi:uncharacterized protein (TIGR03118 family)
MRLAALTSVLAMAAGVLCATAGHAGAGYLQTNLVSDIPGLAQLTDPELVNPWGISYSATSPVWVSDQETNVSTLYAVSSTLNVNKAKPGGTNGNIAIPQTMAGPQGPTGQVNNGTSSFPVTNGGNGMPAHFIFANLNGTVSAWDAGQMAFVQATTPGATYTGLALGSVNTTPYLYAANDAGTGSIEVFDGGFTNVSGTTFAGKFVDPNLPAGLVPFNVQNIGGSLYVEYAPAGRANQTMAALGQGVVDVFDTSGNLIERLITGGNLAAPWGVALAPADFGEFSNDLLVGNFSYLHSEINAFDPINGIFVGSIPIDVGAHNTPGGLWALDFGRGGSNGGASILFFTDGINGEAAGLFGAFTVPEPCALSLLAAGLGLFAVWRFSRSAQLRA